MPTSSRRRIPDACGWAAIAAACAALAFLQCGPESDGGAEECSFRELRIEGRAIDHFTGQPVTCLDVRLDSLYTIGGLYGQRRTVLTTQPDSSGRFLLVHGTDAGRYGEWDVSLDAAEAFTDTFIDTATGMVFEYGGDKHFGKGVRLPLSNNGTPDSQDIYIDETHLGEVRFLPVALVWFRLQTDNPLQPGDTLGFDGGWIAGDTIMDWYSPLQVVGDSVHTTRWRVKRGAAPWVDYEDTLLVPRWSVREYVLVY